MESGKDHLGVTSPFSQVSATIPAGDEKKAKVSVWVLGVSAAVIVLSAGGFFAWNALADPLRTLPAFPVDKYFANYESLAGASFKADLRVDADIGWRAGVGRLLVFTTMNDGSSGNNRLAVLVPAELAGAVFDKNQAYRVELEVQEGGIIRAKSFKKL